MNCDPNLIFDVGMHKGEDTDFYLKKGFRVVSFEADPDLVKHCKRRFADQIARDQLNIIEGAIAPEQPGDRVQFYTSSHSVWGTIRPEWVARNAVIGGATSRLIEVRRVDITEIFNRFGVPFYLKIDVEGVDHHVLQVLQNLSCRPQYISIESEKNSFQELISEMNQLVGLGYKKFKIVQQKNIPNTQIVSHDVSGNEFEYIFENHSSGPFGEEIRQPWVSYNKAIRRYRAIYMLYMLVGDRTIFSQFGSHRNRITRAIQWSLRLPSAGWYDTHASL
jgi:FkbM family methyltransferase